MRRGSDWAVEVHPILREYNGEIRDDHPMHIRRSQQERIIDLNAEPWALVCSSLGVDCDGIPEAVEGRSPEDRDGLLWAATAICQNGSKVRVGGQALIQAADSGEVGVKWDHFDDYRQILDFEIPGLFALDVAANPWIGRLIVFRLLQVTEADRGLDFPAAHLTRGERQWVAAKLKATLARLTPSTIQNYTATAVAPSRRAALLAAANGLVTVPTFMADTPALPWRRISVFHAPGTDPDDRWFVDGHEVVPHHVKTIDHLFFDEVFVHERIVWLSRGEAVLEREGEPTTTVMTAHKRAQPAPPSSMGSIIRNTVRRIRRIVTRPQTGAEGKSAAPNHAHQPLWLYVDRHDMAGDNAEPLYRHAVENVPGARHVFALEASSADWARLESEGFNLVDMKSPDFALAWSQAAVLLLSDIGDPLVAPRLTGKGTRRDQRVIFLQHGVTMRDMWRWMNGKRIDVLITATPTEHEAIIRDHSSYTLTEPEVWLTGFPRHDLLHPLLGQARERVILAPTWQFSLLRQVSESPDNYRALDQAYRPWLELAQTLMRGGRRVVLFIHPKVASLAPQWVERLRVETITGREVPAHLARAIVAISDRSSLLDEAMLLGGGAIVWDPAGAPDTDRYRQMHVGAGALEATSAEEAVRLVDGFATGLLKPSDSHIIRDAGARQRIIERMVEDCRRQGIRDSVRPVQIESACPGLSTVEVQGEA